MYCVLLYKKRGIKDYRINNNYEIKFNNRAYKNLCTRYKNIYTGIGGVKFNIITYKNYFFINFYPLNLYYSNNFYQEMH